MAYVRHYGNGHLYKYEGDNIFTNVITGKSGRVESVLASKIFGINLEATHIINQYPLVLELIQKLELKIEKTSHL